MAQYRYRFILTRLLSSTLGALISLSHAVAELRPAQARVDFGRVSTLSFPQREVMLQAMGLGPIEILEARGSCGCLQVEVLTPRLEPGQSGCLRLSLYPLRAPAGENIWEVRVRYRQGEVHGETRMAVTAQIVREVTVQPPQIELAVSSEIEQDIVVTDHRERPLEVVRLEATSSAVSAQLVDKSNDVRFPRQFRIRLKIDGSQLQDTQESLLVIHTNDPQCPQLLVPVRLRRLAQAPILVAPSEVSLAITGNEPVSRLITLRDRKGRPSRIVRVECELRGLQCSWSQGSYPVSTVRLTVQPDALPQERVRGELRVHFVEPEECVVRIPLHIQRR